MYDVTRALSEPAELDGFGSVFDLRGLIKAEIGGACFVAADVVVTTTSEENDPDSDDDLAPQHACPLVC